MTAVLAAISWDPYIIGVLSVAIAVVVLCGSVWLLLATNVGTRLGFLLAWTGLWGWMLLIGIIWWVYAIGLIGDGPSWQVKETVTGDGLSFVEAEDARVLPTDPANVELSQADVPEGWTLLDGDDPDRAEAQAAADEFLVEDPLINSLFASPTTADYLPVRAFQTGGDRWPSLFGYSGKPLGWFGDPNYIVLQVQPAGERPPLDVNAAPPPRGFDLGQPLISVVLVRDQGNVRFPPAVVTIASGIAFALGAYLLHQRDKRLWEAQGVSTPASSA